MFYLFREEDDTSVNTKIIFINVSLRFLFFKLLRKLTMYLQGMTLPL